MTIVGIGTDIVEVERIAKLLAERGERGRNALFTALEADYCTRFPNPELHFAGRFAAKEAVAKALGTGFSKGVTVRGIEILANGEGQPYVALSGAASAVAAERGITRILVSISHEAVYAVAFAVALAE
ncbi:MAG: holo-ACP synthase [Planctomycetota bacterium]